MSLGVDSATLSPSRGFAVFGDYVAGAGRAATAPRPALHDDGVGKPSSRARSSAVRSLTLAAGATVAVIAVVWPARPTYAAAEAAGATTAYVPVVPCRVVDTRGAGGPNVTMTVRLAGVCGVPGGASAVVVTLTVPAAPSAGFLTAYPTGSSEPLASNVNFERRATIANTAAVQLGAGSLTLTSNVPTDKIVDVVGSFVPVGHARSGRFAALTARRLLDTRTGTKVPAATTVTAVATDVPADATALAVNLTFTDATAPGFFTTFGDGPRPNVSTGNADAAGQTRATFAVVPASSSLHVYSQSGAHVIVDLVGYFTGLSAPDSTDGLFVPQSPTRVLDTRARPGVPIGPGGSAEVSVVGGAAVWSNITAVDAAPGFLAARPADARGAATTSTVNATNAHQTIANAAITLLADSGMTVLTPSGAHVLVDVAGLFTGNPTGSPPLPVFTDETIGQSAGGRPIVASHLVGRAAGPTKVLVLGFMHGEEQSGLTIVNALRSAAVPATVDLWLMDTVNPDGAASRQRGNAHGVDLNRNFDGGSFPWCPTPGCGAGASPADTGPTVTSEPETVAFSKFVNREQFDLVVSYHEPLDTVDCSPYRGDRLTAVCTAYATASGIPFNRSGYIDLSGTMTNSYMQANPGRWAFTVEFPGTGVGDVPRHLAAVWAAAAAVGS